MINSDGHQRWLFIGHSSNSAGQWRWKTLSSLHWTNEHARLFLHDYCSAVISITFSFDGYFIIHLIVIYFLWHRLIWFDNKQLVISSPKVVDFGKWLQIVWMTGRFFPFFVCEKWRVPPTSRPHFPPSLCPRSKIPAHLRKMFQQKNIPLFRNFNWNCAHWWRLAPDRIQNWRRFLTLLSSRTPLRGWNVSWPVSLVHRLIH